MSAYDIEPNKNNKILYLESKLSMFGCGCKSYRCACHSHMQATKTHQHIICTHKPTYMVPGVSYDAVGTRVGLYKGGWAGGEGGQYIEKGRRTVGQER